MDKEGTAGMSGEPRVITEGQEWEQRSWILFHRQQGNNPWQLQKVQRRGKKDTHDSTTQEQLSLTSRCISFQSFFL